jgi:hypothetical protein
LFFTPEVVPCTFTDTVHEVPGARLAPDKLIFLEPLVAAAVPLQVLFRLLGLAITSPAGKLSVNATPFKVRLALLLLSVKVRLVVPFNGIVVAPNAWTTLGGLTTVRLGLAEAVLPLPASVESMVTLLL